MTTNTPRDDAPAVTVQEAALIEQRRQLGLVEAAADSVARIAKDMLGSRPFEEGDMLALGSALGAFYKLRAAQPTEEMMGKVGWKPPTK